MIKTKNKKLSLLMAIVFAFTVLVPAGAVFADDASINGNYKYISTGEQNAGQIAISDLIYEDNLDTIVIRLSLPEGIEFIDEPNKNWTGESGSIFAHLSSDVSLIDSSSDYYEIELPESDFSGLSDGNELNDELVFKFSGQGKLDIDDDFSGNLDVDVEVLGLGADSHLWSESDSVTIAKVSGDKATATVEDLKKVSAGKGKEAAEITIEEPIAGTISENVYFEIETSGVEFHDDTTASSSRIELVKDGTDVDINEEEAWVEIDNTSSGLPGKIKFTPYLNIDPDVSGDIEITIYGDDDELEEETLIVAAVGEASAEVIDLEDNDTVVYAGQDEELEVSFTVEAVGNDFDEDDIFTFTLNEGKFDVDEMSDEYSFYNDDESFYYIIESDDKEEFEIKDIYVKLDNDAEPGDLTLDIGGDYGDLGEITIGEIAKPYSVSADKLEIQDKAVDQKGADIYIIETDDGAFDENEYIYVELPSGVELSEKPKIETVEGRAEAEIEEYDSEEGFVIEITHESTSKPSEFRVYNISYDTRLALEGDVELKFGGDSDYEGDLKDFDFEDDSVMHTIANAVISDSSKVTASFNLGDEGVTIQNGRTLVQVNMLSDILNLQKSWDAENKIAYFVKAGTTVLFPIDENKIIINGNAIPVDQGGVIENDFTYATLRGIQMAFGGELEWDDAAKTATFKFDK